MPCALNNTTTALNYDQILSIPTIFGCPVWVYDAEIIKKKIEKLRNFDVIRFAQKACANINILRIIREQGVKLDAVSLGEMQRALQAGFSMYTGDEVVFTADVFDQATIIRIMDLNIQVNAGSIDMLEQIGKKYSRHYVWLRVNPGFGHGHSEKTNTGGENSKHGIWYSDIPKAMMIIKKYELQLIGIHMHIGSGVNYHHLKIVCDALVEHVMLLGKNVRAISAGGGLSIPYSWWEKEINIHHYYNIWNKARNKIIKNLRIQSLTIEIEPGRFLLAEAGILISKVHAVKNMGNRHFILIDAGFNDLIRPVIYGSYHYISLLPADGRHIEKKYLRETVIAGPLCESGDVFTQNKIGEVETRALPIIKVGDYIIVHDTGAYGASMSSNYNSRPLISEVLLDHGEARLIRKTQNINELIALECI